MDGEARLSVVGTPDAQLVRSDWTSLDELAIDGVATFQMANVLTDSGALTEMWRADWRLDELGVEQVFQRTLDPDALSAWHVHLQTTDRLFCATGRVLVVLFDARLDAATHGNVAELRLGEQRPAVISIPPGVYHGVKNIGPSTATVINAVDRAYAYERPDHHRVPADSTDIPYRW